jgi:hypothetical protein
MTRKHQIKPRFTGHCRTVGPHMEVTSCHPSYTYYFEETPWFCKNLWTPDLETFLLYPIEPFTQHLKNQIYVILGILSITLHMFVCVCVCVCVCASIYIYIYKTICNKGLHGHIFTKSYGINLLVPELILAHPVYKMWIIWEPNTLELWNKLHFEEEKTESIYHV